MTRTAPLSDPDLAQIARVLRGAGISYALLFGSAGSGALGGQSDLDIAVAGDAPLSSAQREALIGSLALVARRPIDLVDLKAARGVVFARALQGREIFCDSLKAKAEALLRRVGIVQEDLELARRSFATARRAMFR